MTNSHKWQVFEYAPDVYGTIHYGLRCNDFISAKSYNSKFQALIQCLIMNGDTQEIDLLLSNLDARLNEIRNLAKMANNQSSDAQTVIAGLILDSVNEILEMRWE